jgi:hypothetical protein
VGERGGACGGEEGRTPQRNSPPSVVLSSPPSKGPPYIGGGEKIYINSIK